MNTQLGKRLIRLLFAIVGGSVGIYTLPFLWQALNGHEVFFDNALATLLINFAIGATVFVLISFVTLGKVITLVKAIETFFTKQSPTVLLFGSLGTIIGLVIGTLFSMAINGLNIPIIGSVLSVSVTVVCAYLGLSVGTNRSEDWQRVFQWRGKKAATPESVVLERKEQDGFHKHKILDTSAIIDGRIAEVIKTGFLEGIIVIPEFVLHELQYIADATDTLKRMKGRRGLDILNEMQKNDKISVETYDIDFEETLEVDAKLVKLAKQLDGVVVTNDFNLNKVCEFQNVPVLNVNALANAVKPAVLPGELMQVMIVKSGTERQQGVAYTEDGTMIVVEDGNYFMNEVIEVVVTSALQTAAGRMIFAKPTQKKISKHG